MAAPESWYVTRTLGALELLAFAPATASELAHRLEVHPRTVRRMLSRLQAEGYVRHLDGQRYAPTMRIVAIAAQLIRRSELAHEAVARVRRLRDDTGASAHLTVPSYDSVLCVVHAEGGRPAADDGDPHPRELAPCHCTAAGKALLAWRHGWRRDVLARPLVACTERSITEPAALERAATAVRVRGFATEDGEHRRGWRGVAAAVYDAEGEALGALAITAPTAALPDLDAAGRRVADAAVELSAALGFDLDEESALPARALRTA